MNRQSLKRSKKYEDQHSSKTEFPYRLKILRQDLTEANFAARTLDCGRCIVILGQSCQAEAVAVVEWIEDVHRRRLHGIQTTYSTTQFPVRQGAPFPLPRLTCGQDIRKKDKHYIILFFINIFTNDIIVIVILARVAQDVNLVPLFLEMSIKVSRR